MEEGGVIGVVASALVLVLPIMVLHQFGGGIGSDALPAPQAGLMSTVSQGIIGGDMRWELILMGMFFATALILIQSPSPMLIAVGMYLPFPTTLAIFAGGLIKWICDAIAKRKTKEDKVKAEKVENRGLLVASGLVAGEAMVGILLAAVVALNVKFFCDADQAKEVTHAQVLVANAAKLPGDTVEDKAKLMIKQPGDVANNLELLGFDTEGLGKKIEANYRLANLTYVANADRQQQKTKAQRFMNEIGVLPIAHGSDTKTVFEQKAKDLLASGDRTLLVSALNIDEKTIKNKLAKANNDAPRQCLGETPDWFGNYWLGFLVILGLGFYMVRSSLRALKDDPTKTGGS
jgi:hypothetical protein